jgi:hypothetical protein
MVRIISSTLRASRACEQSAKALGGPCAIEAGGRYIKHEPLPFVDRVNGRICPGKQIVGLQKHQARR